MYQALFVPIRVACLMSWLPLACGGQVMVGMGVTSDAGAEEGGADAGEVGVPDIDATCHLTLLETRLASVEWPKAVGIADLNGDGRPEVVAANLSSNDVSVFKNLGNGVFGLAEKWPVGGHPGIVTFGEFKNNGYVDIAVALPNSDLLSLLSNDGIGGFGEVSSYAAGSLPSAIAAGDLDKDGKIDVAVAGNGSVGWLRNMGDNYSLLTLDSDTTIAGSLDIGDLDGDGRLDLAVGHTPKISILMNSGAGTFETGQQLDVSNTATTVLLWDLTRDGRPDMLAIDQGTWTASIRYWINDGGGTLLKMSHSTLAGAKTRSLAVADFNRDGWPDVVFADGDGWINLVFGPDFKNEMTLAVKEPSSVAAADLNGDGLGDVVASSPSSNQVSVFLSQCEP
jgi:hypothetical protein